MAVEKPGDDPLQWLRDSIPGEPGARVIKLFLSLALLMNQLVFIHGMSFQSNLTFGV